MAVLFQFRRDTAANWTSTDPVLAQGEIGLEIDSNNIKVGDGVTAWTSLVYFTGTGIADEDIDDRVAALLQAGNGIDLNYDDVNNELTITSEVTEITAYNGTGVTIPKGSVVYQTGVQGNDISVALADNSSAATMPASGIVIADIADMSTGQIAVAGFVKSLDTSAFSVGDTLYVGSSGALTSTRPTGESNLVQNFGKAIKINAASGEILVAGAGRSNDVPNLADGNVFIGNISNVAEKRALVEADISDFGTYLTAEADTLDSVTGRGSTTTNDITVQNATVNGDLNVAGTTTTINTANLNVADKNITINYSTGDSSITADGAGITIQDAVDATTDATILWDATNDEFDFSHNITVPAATIANGLTVDTDTLVVDDVANTVSVGTVFSVASSAITGGAEFDASGRFRAQSGGGGLFQLDSQNNSETLPTYTFRGDGDTGMWWPGANSIAWSANGGERMRLTTTGLGIGMPSPSTKLDVAGSGRFYEAAGTTNVSLTAAESNDTQVQFGSFGAAENVGKIVGNSAALSLDLYTNGARRATIDSSGNIGFRYNSPATFNQVTGQGRFVTGAGSLDEGMTIYSGSAQSGSIVFADGTTGTDQWRGVVQYNHNNDEMNFFTTNTLRATINSGGKVLIGSSTAVGDATLVTTSHGGGQAGLAMRNNSAAAGKWRQMWTDTNNRLVIQDNGTVGVFLDDNGTTWGAYSDETLKENISDIGPVLDAIKDFRCVNYSLKATESEAADKVGFIAQDWEHTFPNVVDKDEDGKLSMRYTETIPVLLKAIQEQQVMIEELKAEVEALKA